MNRNLLLDFTVFVCGMAVMMIELLGARMIVPFYGDSFFVWTSVIGVVLVFLSLGYYRGGVYADRDKKMIGLSHKITNAAICIALLPFLISIGGIFSSVSLKFGSFFTALLGLSLPSYNLAMVTPYAIRLSARDLHNTGKISGRFYALSTIGGILGTFLTGFVFIPFFGIREIVYLLSFVLLAISALMYSRYKSLDFAMLISIVVIQIIWLPTSAAMAINRSSIIYEGDSVYNSIAVFEINASNDTYRVLQLGNLIHGGVSDESKSFYRYVDYFELPWLLERDIRKVLFLGNGAGVGIMQLHKKYPETVIDVVDIDPEVYKIAKMFFNEREDSHLRFHVDDARIYLRKSDQKYDVIIIDVYGATHRVPPHLVTKEMMSTVEERLNERGIVISNILSAVEGENSKFLKSFYATSKSVFPKNYIVPISRNSSNLNLRTTVLVFSGKSTSKLDKERIEDAIATISSEYNASKPRVLDDATYSTEGAIILTDNYAPVESMIK